MRKNKNQILYILEGTYAWIRHVKFHEDMSMFKLVTGNLRKKWTFFRDILKGTYAHTEKTYSKPINET